MENLRQGSQEEATDFLVQVGDAVENLGKDWKGILSSEELDTLQYTVSLNGVREDIRHVLNTDTSKCGRLTPQQMYDAVRKHEVYVSRNKHLEGSSPYTGCPQAPRASQGTSYKPRYQKTTAFAAAVMEPEEASDGYEVTSSGEEGTPEAEPPSEEQRGVFVPHFPSSSTDAHWGLNMRVACAIQADEQLRKCCFACHSPDHFIRECPQAKNVKWPLKPKGPHKNKSVPLVAKAQASPPAQLVPQLPPPLEAAK